MNRLDPAIVLGGVLVCAGMGCAQIIGIEDLPEVEDMADSGTCMPACMDDTLQVCEPEPTLVPCPLSCNAEAQACRTVVPSNGAETGHLQGVSKALVIPTSPDPQTLASIDTDTGRIVDVYGNVLRSGGEGVVDGMGFYRLDENRAVLAVTELVIEPDGFVFAFGARSLIILSAGDVLIEGVMDVSAFCDVDGTSRCGGPGGGDGALSGVRANAEGCAPGGNGSGTAGAGGEETGGGGGGLGQAGAAAGESGDGIAAPGEGGQVAGSACPGPELVPLGGGSGGGFGGLPGFGGFGGGGGGALQITSLTRIDFNGLGAGRFVPGILANGGGGGGALDSSGGGGGGSGGAILLEAPEIALRRAVLTANGGGGGGGGGGDVAGPTTPGEDGLVSDEQAQGGTGRNAGGLGGSRRGDPRPGDGGGDDTGGGGGGAGILRFNVPASGLVIDEDSIISPAHTRGDPLIE